MRDLGSTPSQPASIIQRGDMLAGVTTGTVTQGTSSATITGLSVVLTPGTYAVNAYLTVVTVGTVTQFLSAQFTGTGTTGFNSVMRMRNGAATSIYYAYPIGTDINFGAVAAATTGYQIYGLIVVTGSGTYSIAGYRTGGTSMVTQAGATLTIVRV